MLFPANCFALPGLHKNCRDKGEWLACDCSRLSSLPTPEGRFAREPDVCDFSTADVSLAKQTPFGRSELWEAGEKMASVPKYTAYRVLIFIASLLVSATECKCMDEGLVSNETVVLRWWRVETNAWFINGVDN